MAAQRQYEAAMAFGVRAVDMRHFWEPSREYKGKPTEKPNWFGSFITPKTQAQWHVEPIFSSVAAALGKIWTNNQQVTTWPIVDGDMPNPETGKHSDFARGHWMFGASTGNQPKIEMVQQGGTLVVLPNKTIVKPGDYCNIGVTAAVKANDARGVKFYLNAVVFTGPGEEIAFANSVSGAQLQSAAEQQGLRPTGFAPNSFGGGGGQPQGGGFGGGTAPGPFGGQPQGGNAPGPFGGAGGGAAPGAGPFGGGGGAAPGPFGGHPGQAQPQRGPFG